VLIDLPQSFANWDNLEGLLLCEMGKINRQELRRMIPADLPVMNLLYNDPVFPSVQADDAAGGRLLTEHLLELGHRRIGYLGFYHHPPVHLRYQAYRETLLRKDIEPVESWSRLPEASLAGSYCKAGYLTMRQWLKEGFKDSGCTAILAQNDQTAFGIIRALQEVDIEVPGEVSVAGFDGVPNAALDGVSDEYWQPLQLTSIQVPLFDIAAIALKVLLGKAAQAPQVGRPIILSVELKEGESCTAVSDVSWSYDAVRV
jgi:DNA-binding LacI/PurR family transcriptional regulator